VGEANADALLPSLISTQRWTLFYWGQDRLANLVALIAMPVRDPVWNFEVQSLIIAAAFFGVAAACVSYYAWARQESARPIEHAIATGLTGVLVMAPLHSVAGYRFAIEQLYFVSVLCWVGAVWAWHQRRRFVIGGVLLQIATLVNPSLLLASPLVWLLDHRREGRIGRSAGFVGAAVTAFVVTDVAARLFATGDDADLPYDEFHLDQLATGIRLSAGNIAGSVRDRLATTVVVIAVGVVAVSIRRLAPRAAAIYIALPVFSIAWLLTFSVNGWVIWNLHEFRYFYPLYVTFVLFVAGAATEVVLGTRRWRTSDRPEGDRPELAIALGLVAVIVAASVAVLTIRTTSVPTLMESDETVAAAREFDTRLIAGGYWTVWPAVVAGRSEGLDLLGISYRADPILGEIRDELDRAADHDQPAAVVCSGVDAADCVDLVNERSNQVWTLDTAINEWPLVIRILPNP
jgi:hypothetical protein